MEKNWKRSFQFNVQYVFNIVDPYGSNNVEALTIENVTGDICLPQVGERVYINRIRNNNMISNLNIDYGVVRTVDHYYEVVETSIPAPFTDIVHTLRIVLSPVYLKANLEKES